MRLALKPLGRQINEGLLARLWHKISGSSKQRAGLVPARRRLRARNGSARRRGAHRAPSSTRPVDGTIASISDTILNGSRHGSRIDIRPTAAPSVIVSLDARRIPDPALAVGSAVIAGSSKIGAVADIAQVERQALARHTNDNGDNVAIEVHPAPASLP